MPMRSQGYCGDGRGLSGLHWVCFKGRGPHLGLRQEPQVSSPGMTGISGLHSRLTWGVRPRFEGNQMIPLSSRVAPGISWTQLSGLKGVNPPVKFGERTRDCSPGQAGKEGPHLFDGGILWFFSNCGATVGFLTRYDGVFREPLVWY